MSDETKESVTEQTAAKRTEPIVKEAEPVERRDTGEANGNGNAPADAPSGTETGDGELLKKLEEVTAEADAQRDRYMRAVAEMDNLRRRTAREKDEVRRYAVSGLVEDLLPVIDHFSLGLDAARGHEGGKAFAEGFEMILGQLRATLERHGVSGIDPEGEVFDPNLHECVSHQPHATVEEGAVISVERVGYKLHDRLLRPASVVVSSGPAKPSSAEDADSADGDN
ncbi:MAG: nucleotide exchange factor GrpE [Opitutales bacterium]|nr:nucleotide exchange factor GrpE [Opitutales bacterium]